MAKCETCGPQSLRSNLVEESHTFDSFECAIPHVSTHLSALGVPDNRAWRRETRKDRLLSSFCFRGLGNQTKEPK